MIPTICALLCLLLAMNACAVCLGETAQADGRAVRTILLYCCGADLETNFGMATWNLYQILESEIPPEVNFLVMTGGSRVWKTEAEYLEGAESISPDRENQLWLCSGRNAGNAVNGHGRMTLLPDIPSEIENTLMSDPKTLTGFIDYAAEKYPAQMYDLILWDHGGGPVLGYGSDDRVDEQNIMSVGALAKALKQSKVERFDIIDFDACLMSSVEIAAVLSECADYLILSPETEPGYGQEYVTWLDALAKESDMDGFALGRIIVDAMIAFYEDENTPGYLQDGTLAVIDTKNFMDRMVAPITELAGIMDHELTHIGKNNALLNFEDELRSQTATLEYASPTLLDLGNFAEHLGMCISEVNNLDRSGKFEDLRNSYTDTAEEIKHILSDSDGSGDDVIYAAATAGMTKSAKTRIAFARDEAGKPQRVETMAPSGLSVFFSPINLEVMDYSVAIDEMCDAVEDEATRTMLRALEVVSLRYLLAEKCGLTVTELREAGQKNVYYKTVRDEWQSSKDRSYGEIYKYQEQFGIKADITGLSAADWDVYISTIIDLLNQYSDVDTETWLALLTAQQSSQMLDCSETTAIGVDKTGDGVEDAYRVTISAPLNLVRNVYSKLSFRLQGEEGEEGEENGEDGEEDEVDWLSLLVDIPDDIDIAKVYGDPVQESIVQYAALDMDIAYGIQELFEKESCTYEVPAAIDYWYELLDSEGIGHVISVDVVDLGTMQDLKIPVIIHFAEPTPEGEDWNEDGYLVYGNGHFKGFLQDSGYYPMISLSDSAFYGATIQTAALLPVNIFGFDITIFSELSEPFALPEERVGDCGMKLVKTPIDDIKDLADKKLKSTTIVTDLYDREHDISAAIQAAREAVSAGDLTYDLKAAEITVPELVFNRRLQKPEPIVMIGGKALEMDVDYELTVEPMLKAGTKEITLFGIGKYVGYKSALFTILPAESTVEAVNEAAFSELSDGDRTVLTVNTPAHPENVQFDFSGTDEKLRDYLKEGADGKTVLLKKGAEAGVYEVKVSVVDGGANTYSNIDGAVYVIEVK